MDIAVPQEEIAETRQLTPHELQQMRERMFRGGVKFCDSPVLPSKEEILNAFQRASKLSELKKVKIVNVKRVCLFLRGFVLLRPAL